MNALFYKKKKLRLSELINVNASLCIKFELKGNGQYNHTIDGKLMFCTTI